MRLQGLMCKYVKIISHCSIADRGEVERILVRPNLEGVAAMYAAITGKAPTREELARLADRMASLSN